MWAATVGGLQGVREERVWFGSDAGLPGGGVAVQGPLDGGHQHGPGRGVGGGVAVDGHTLHQSTKHSRSESEESQVAMKSARWPRWCIQLLTDPNLFTTTMAAMSWSLPSTQLTWLVRGLLDDLVGESAVSE